MIEVMNLYHDYEGKGNYAVKDISFKIEKGKIFGFLGPSGAGKSTVQNIMTKLLPLQKGEIRYLGKNLASLNKVFFNNIGYSFEHPNIFTRLTGYENLHYFAGLFNVPTEKPEKLMNMVGLTSSMHKRAGRYSKGMKQRLIFARSIINRPKILFLDEPLSGLDPSTANVIKEVIRSLKAKGTTIIMTTHNMHAADELCDTVAFINEGKIVACDTPRNLKLEHGEKGVALEYTKNGEVVSEIVDLSQKSGLERFNSLVNENIIETIHSKEASLETIFTKLTGRGLSQ